MNKSISRGLCLFAVALLLVLLVSFSPLIGSVGRAKGSLSQRLQADNVTTSGIVTAVGPSAVGSGPSVVTYSYDAPGFPRNGNAGSFTREQIVEPKEMPRFRSGAKVSVEYSRKIPGMSRLKGYGTGSVFVKEQSQNFKSTALISIACFMFVLLITSFFARRRGYA